jgi:hypothetical protein
MNKLIKIKDHQKVLKLVNRQSILCKDIIYNMTFKSYIHLNSSKSNIKIQEKLLSNSYTQSSLTHFKSKLRARHD